MKLLACILTLSFSIHGMTAESAKRPEASRSLAGKKSGQVEKEESKWSKNLRSKLEKSSGQYMRL